MYLALLNFIVILTLVGAAFSIVMMQRGALAARAAERRFNRAREELIHERITLTRQGRSALDAHGHCQRRDLRREPPC